MTVPGQSAVRGEKPDWGSVPGSPHGSEKHGGDGGGLGDRGSRRGEATLHRARTRDGNMAGMLSVGVAGRYEAHGVAWMG